MAELPQEGQMSFLEHLDELRRRLTYSAAAIMIAFILCFALSEKIYSFLDKPVRAALQQAKQYRIEQVQTISIESLGQTEFIFVFGKETVLKGVAVPIGATVPAKIVAKGSTRVVQTTTPLVVGRNAIPAGTELPVEIGTGGSNDRLVVHTLQGGFNLYVKVAFYAALALSMPFLMYQVWAFIEPGLYPHEKKYVVPFVAMASIFFLLGATFAYYVAFPRVVEFLLNVSQNFQALIEVNEYFDLIITVILGLGVVFEIPTVVLFLSLFGLLTPQMMLKYWRHAVVAVFIVAAILSPTTDIPNMLVFALPMIALYFFSVGIAWLFGRPRKTVEI
ncbi:MAG: twin-arginine translocase subunit TatC [Acidobacteriota bacterium]|nr:twin-arginine translocase subunit TatC [Blastocatellia bacterium]MDW8413425.1 twin-arginine translocase subunit TatC [Acidobacteriota bacterium]